MSTTQLLLREWTVFRRPARLVALAVAVLAVVGPGLLVTSGMHASCAGVCPSVPVAASGSGVSDRFWFLHRDLGREGSITVRLTSMTGTVTYPPPDHDQLGVPGLVPWAKTGIIVKDGTRQGSPYAALMMTGSHGVRFQHGYAHDVAGRPGGVSERSPRWLRLTRSGDLVTAAESTDGRRWRTDGQVRLHGLPDTVQVGLFATSPGDLTLDEVGLGGAVETVRTTQAVGVFDHVTVDGDTTGTWTSEPVGEMNQTEWEKDHHASGAVRRGGVITVSGTGDIGPLSEDNVDAAGAILPGLVIALAVLLVVAARHGARTAREHAGRRVVTARAAVLGAVAFGAGLLAVGVAVPVGMAILDGNGVPTAPLPALTAVRVVVGVAAALALCTVLAYGLGVWLRRGWAASLVGLTLVVLPYTVATVPLLPDPVADWLLRLTPAAGLAARQTLTAYPQVTAHYAPSAGYYPLPVWAGLAVLCAYTALTLVLAVRAMHARQPG